MKHNCLLSGNPGSGKTFLIKQFIEWAQTYGYKVGITATTGCSAYLINGQTINSWAGVGLCDKPVDYLVANVVKYKKAKTWMTTDILIIDEISMMSKDMFEKLNSVGKIIRKNDKTFGGIHLICVGDFSQLSPVNGEFIFKSELFEHTFDYGIFLDKIYRQKDDDFLKLLNEIRLNKLSTNSVSLLSKIKQKQINKSDSIQPTILLPLNKQVEIINNNKLNEINEKEYIFKYRKMSCKMSNKNSMPPEVDKLIEKFTNVNPILKLKKNTQVMLLKNIHTDIGLVNGSVGIIRNINCDNVIVEFINGLTIGVSFEQFKIENDEFELTFEMIPLTVAYAISIHKSQGTSIDCCQIDIGKTIFQPQQAYVALSRITNPHIDEKEHNKGLYIIDFDVSSFKVYKDTLEFYDRFNEINKIDIN